MSAIFRNFLSKKQLRECEQVGALLSPELADNFYNVNLPTAHPPIPRALAFAARGNRSFIVCDAIKQAGLWQGAKPAIVWCRRLGRHQMLGTLLHEAGHLLPYVKAPEPVVVSEEERVEWNGFMAARFNRGYTGDSPTLPAWHSQHGRAFVRRVLHLHYRAWQNGLEVGLPELGICGAHYDLSQPYKYRSALGDEPRRMIDEDFATIEATPAPSEFVSLFAADFEEWCDRRTSIGDLLGTNK